MSLKFSRREFLRHSAVTLTAGAVVGPVGSVAAGAKATPMTIIDTHQHLWDLRRFRLPWVKPGTALARNHLLSDYHAAAAGTGIERTIYMEVDVDPAQQQEEADFVVACCRDPQSKMVAGVISGRPAADGFKAYASAFKGSPHIKGIRQVLHGGAPKGYCLDPKFVAGIRLLGELGLRFDLCMSPDDLSDAGRLVDACPETQFILDHCGNAPVHTPDGAAPDRTQWRRDMEQLARRKNLVCKVSGLVNTATKGAWGPDDLAPIINHVLAAFGPDRVMFGGDWPVCTTVASLAEWVSALKSVVAARPENEQRRLFSENAMRVYALA